MGKYLTIINMKLHTLTLAGAFLTVTAATLVKGSCFCVGEIPERAPLLAAGVVAFAGETGSSSTLAEVIFLLVVTSALGDAGTTFKVPVKDCKLTKTPSSFV